MSVGAGVVKVSGVPAAMCREEVSLATPECLQTNTKTMAPFIRPPTEMVFFFLKWRASHVPLRSPGLQLLVPCLFLYF